MKVKVAMAAELAALALPMVRTLLRCRLPIRPCRMTSRCLEARKLSQLFILKVGGLFPCLLLALQGSRQEKASLRLDPDTSTTITPCMGFTITPISIITMEIASPGMNVSTKEGTRTMMTTMRNRTDHTMQNRDTPVVRVVVQDPARCLPYRLARVMAESISTEDQEVWGIMTDLPGIWRKWRKELINDRRVCSLTPILRVRLLLCRSPLDLRRD